MLRAIAVVPAVLAAVALGACGSADAREEGMTASFSNTATAVEDRQAVAVFVMKDAGVAAEVSDRVRESAPKSARLIAHDRVLVVYAAAGTDRAAAVERAVQAL